MSVLTESCAACGVSFTILPGELEFRELMFRGQSISPPPPRECPLCRRQRRLAWRNVRTLHRRNCDLCGKSTVSMYALEAECLVYCQSCFWSDRWDPHAACSTFDFSRPFFEQFAALTRRTPFMSLINTKTENSEYCNRIFDGRDNYLSFIALYSPENLLHTHYTQTCKDCVDIAFCQKTQHSYEVVDAENCYHCAYSARIIDCVDSYFLEDCIGCSYCFGCKNLTHRSYCVFNEQYSKDEYLAYLRAAGLNRHSAVEHFRHQARDFFISLPSRAVVTRGCEAVTGADLIHCKDCHECFELYECESMRHSAHGEKSHSLVDCYGFGMSGHCLESITIQNSQNIFFSATAIDCSALRYCFECYAGTKDCFGCAGLKKAQYCILNKPYARGDYEKLLLRIAHHLLETGELGNFFPMALSPFAYNGCDVQTDFPLSREEAAARGLRWQEIAPLSTAVTRKADELPDAIDEAGDDLASTAIECALSKVPFRLTRAELDFYRKHGIPLPRLHPNERFRRMNVQRGGRRLWQRECVRCHNAVPCAYPPERPDLVYCEECYHTEVF